MKINDIVYAIVTPDGEICGDGASECIGSAPGMLEDELSDDVMGLRIRRLNGSDELRVARLHLVEAEKSQDGNALCGCVNVLLMMAAAVVCVAGVGLFLRWLVGGN